MPAFLSSVGIIGPAANGRATIGTNTTSAAGGLWFGTDVDLYRSAADTLKTDDNFVVAGSLTASGYDLVMPAVAADTTNEPSGFEDRTSSTISLVDAGATLTFTIAPTGASFPVWIQGARQLRTTESLSIAKATGSVFVYYNSAGVLTQSSVPWVLGVDTPIVLIYYSGTAGTAIMCEERHGCVMDSSTHYYLHTSRGAQLGSGAALGNYAVQQGSPTNANNRWSLSSGSVLDEDLTHTLAGLAAGGPYTVMRRVGATEWTWTSETDPFITVGGKIAYNSLTGGVWGQTAVPNHDYANYWVFIWGTTSAATQTLVVQGQNFYATLAAAQAATVEANLDVSLYPFIECVARYQITMRREDSYSTNGACRIEAVTQLVQRSLAVSGQLAASNHATLSNRSLTDQHPASAITNTPAGTLASIDVQSALNELDTEKVPVNGVYALATTDLLTSKVTGDAASRWIANADGSLEWGDGTNAADTNLYRSAANVLKTDDTFAAVGGLVSLATNYGVAVNGLTGLTSIALYAQAAGGAAAGFMMRGSGEMNWGDGTNAADTNLYRSAANVLKTDDSLYVFGTVIQMGANTYLRQNDAAGGQWILGSKQTADTQYRFDITESGWLEWGPGGVTATDTNLYRSAADVLKTDDSFVVGGTYASIGTTTAATGILRLPNATWITWRDHTNALDSGKISLYSDDSLYYDAGVTHVFRTGTPPTITDALYTNSAGTIVKGSYLSIGANPAASGAIRLPNNQPIKGRNAANNADQFIAGLDSADNAFLGTSGVGGTYIHGTYTVVSSGVLQVGSATATSGAIRLPNNQVIKWRNAANNADLDGLWANTNDYLATSRNLAVYLATADANAQVALTRNGGGGGGIAFGRGGANATDSSLGWAAVGVIGVNGALSVGYNTAEAGSIRLTNNQGLNWRNAANTIDIWMLLTNTDVFQFGLNANGIYANAPYLSVGGVGAVPAASGALRVATGCGITARNAGNTADIPLITLDNSDNILIGPGIADAGVVWTQRPIATYGSYVAIGTAPAGTGVLRLPTSPGIWYRNSANNANLPLLGATDTVTTLYSQSIIEGSIATVRSLFLNSDWVSLGYNAMLSNAGEGTVAIGASALKANTTGYFNVGVGKGALTANTTAVQNTAVGTYALAAVTTLASGASNNVAVGTQALTAATGITQATAVGFQANVGAGASTFSTTIGSLTVGTGRGSVAIGAATSATHNGSVAIGRSAADAVATTTAADEFMFGVAAHHYVFPGSYVALGTNPAASGALRLANNLRMYFRNATNDGDNLALVIDANNDLSMGSDSTRDMYLGSNSRLFYYRLGVKVIEIGNGYLSIGTNPASQGGLRLPFGSGLWSRNSANNGDIAIAGVAGADILYVGSASSPLTQILSPSVSVGTNPALTGAIRLPNGFEIKARNAANTADKSIINVDASNILNIGPGGSGALQLYSDTGLQFMLIDTSTLVYSEYFRGITDNSYFAWDAGADRIGFTKKGGATGKLTYGSGVSFAIAQSSTTTIAPGSTYTDRFVIDSSGNTTVSGSLTASSFTWPSAVPLMQRASLALAADGTYQIASGGRLDGEYSIYWGGPNRECYITFRVAAMMYDLASVLVLTDYQYGNQNVITNIRVTSSADSTVRYLLIDVANRNGGTGNMIVTATGNTPLNLAAAGYGVTAVTNYKISVADRGNSLAIGTNPAQIGAVRIPNAGSMYWRNAANSADTGRIGYNASDGLEYIAAANHSFYSGVVKDAEIGNQYIAIGTNPAQAGALRLPNSAGIVGRNAANNGDVNMWAIYSDNTTIHGNANGVNMNNTPLLGASVITIGTNPALTGILRLPNNNALYWRNAANNADLFGIYYDSSDVLYVGNSTKPVVVGNNVTVWNATGGVSVAGPYLSVGTNPAGAGAVRVPNAQWVTSRNSTNNGDINMIRMNGTDSLEIGAASVSTFLRSSGVGVDGYLDVYGTKIAIGSNPAQTGVLRLPNNTGIYFRVAANNADVSVLSYDSGNQTYLNGAQLNLQVGSNNIIGITSTQVVFSDAKDLAFGTTTGTKIGTGATQKLALWNATPIVQPANTVAIDTVLVSTGLQASGGTVAKFASAGLSIGNNPAQSGSLRLPCTGPISGRNVTNAADNKMLYTSTSDNTILNSSTGIIEFCLSDVTSAYFIGTTLTFSSGINIAFNAPNGTMIGTTTSQKMGLWGATPIGRPTGWGAPTGTLARSTFATSTVTLEQLAQRVAALITDLTSFGAIGA